MFFFCLNLIFSGVDTESDHFQSDLIHVHVFSSHRLWWTWIWSEQRQQQQKSELNNKACNVNAATDPEPKHGGNHAGRRNRGIEFHIRQLALYWRWHTMPSRKYSTFLIFTTWNGASYNRTQIRWSVCTVSSWSHLRYSNYKQSLLHHQKNKFCITIATMTPCGASVVPLPVKELSL